MVAKDQFNQSVITDFLLLGFSIEGQRRFGLFIVLLIIYIATITANIFIIVIIKADPRLHKPMYFFIGGLSFLELWYPSVTVPRLLWSLKTEDQHISSAGCMAQFYFHFSLGATEMYLLTAMGYDRYVAICNPLRYLIIMSPNVCIMLILGSWVCGFAGVIIPCLRLSTLWYCKGNKIDHYYCDLIPMMHLSCSDTTKAENASFYSICFVTFGCLFLTLISYACITRMVIKLSSASARRKAFSTFASHLFVVILFYGTILFMFIRPASGDSLHFNKKVSVVPSIVTPLLNPIIYTLRNQEVIEAVLKTAHTTMLWSNGCK
ncbi:olfactory receptor 6N2-like [Lithobates pipiens]